MAKKLESLTIGAFAGMAGVNVETICFYQRKGLPLAHSASPMTLQLITAGRKAPARSVDAFRARRTTAHVPPVYDNAQSVTPGWR